jgi:transcriptional regulator with XRE-family HTH domain
VTYPPPGAILRAILRRRGVPLLALEHATGISAGHLHRLLSGKTRIDARLAKYLSQAVPALAPEYWIQAEALYRWKQVEGSIPPRSILPLVPERMPMDHGRCLCGHEQERHIDGAHCEECPCPVYLRAVSVEAYNALYDGMEPIEK